eukprot:CAMPEP_0182562402 /NCGR_PEP_ID=MMETSP1324-20130603/4745_1 /TAXON_ID=236786 /ORGANISM="Florenciella sp., Strain RCC1587" /LENGTH=479 /DNA_ID=CAMNT_0024775347 /DNA_START=209 /DNA_END=1645 /DNA_ORIENTATION=+
MATMEQSRSRSIMKMLSCRQTTLLISIYMAYMVAIFSTSACEMTLPAVVNNPKLHVSEVSTSGKNASTTNPLSCIYLTVVNGLTYTRKGDTGIVLAAGAVGTVVGKLLAGFFVDARGAHAAFYETLAMMGVLLTTGVLAMMNALPSVALFAYALYKVVKAAAWPAMAKLAKDSFETEVFGRVWGILVTSSRIGSVTGGLMLAPTIAIGWQYPILIVSASLFLFSWMVRYQGVSHAQNSVYEPVIQSTSISDEDSLTECIGAGSDDKSSDDISSDGANSNDSGNGTDGANPNQQESQITFGQAMRLYCVDPELLLVIASEAMLLTVMDSGGLLPLYLNKALGVDVSTAARMATLFPSGMAISAFIIGFPYDALRPTGRANMLLGLGCAAIGCFLALGQETSQESTKSDSTIWQTGSLLFLAGATIAPAKYLPSTIYVLENIDSEHSGKVLALMDVPGYVVSAIFFKIYPSLTEKTWSPLW